MMMEAIKDITNDTTDKLNMTIKEILQTIKLNFNDTSKAADLELSSIQDNMHEQLIGQLVYSKSLKNSVRIQSIVAEGIQNNISSSIGDFRLEARNLQLILRMRYPQQRQNIMKWLMFKKKPSIKYRNQPDFKSHITRVYLAL